MTKVNALLLRHKAGYAEATDAAGIAADGRREGFLALAEVDSLAEVDRIASATFDYAATTQWAVRLGILPTGADDEPYVDFGVGDTVTAPDENGAPATPRVVAITVSEDGEGNPLYAPELGNIIRTPEERHRQTVKRMSYGTLSGRSDSATPIRSGSTAIDAAGSPVLPDDPGDPSPGGGCVLETRTVSGVAAYTLVEDDACTRVEVDHNAAVTLTIPTDANVDFPVGTVIEVCQVGTGQVTIAGAVGVVVRLPGGTGKTRVRWSTISLYKRAADEWVLSGDLT